MRTDPGPATSDTDPTAITRLLARARAGETEAERALFDAVYADLKRLARAQLGLRGRAGRQLETTALVHESYLRLAGPGLAAPEDRRHFFNLAARVMRQVIVDFARRREAVKRGAGTVHQELDELLVADPTGGVAEEVLAIDRALADLEAESAHLARLVELRFFAGLTTEELAELLGRSERSVHRDWRRAQAFLAATLRGADRPAPATG